MYGTVKRGDAVRFAKRTWEVTHVAGWAVTSPLRTAYDLARRLPLVEAVVALDALAFAQQIEPADVLLLARRHLGSRGSAQLPEVAALSNAFAESPRRHPKDHGTSRPARFSHSVEPAESAHTASVRGASTLSTRIATPSSPHVMQPTSG